MVVDTEFLIRVDERGAPLTAAVAVVYSTSQRRAARRRSNEREAPLGAGLLAWPSEAAKQGSRCREQMSLGEQLRGQRAAAEPSTGTEEPSIASLEKRLTAGAHERRIT